MCEGRVFLVFWQVIVRSRLGVCGKVHTAIARDEGAIQSLNFYKRVYS
jgi:hypothetical protein